jgi:hypothetical protein
MHPHPVKELNLTRKFPPTDVPTGLLAALVTRLADHHGPTLVQRRVSSQGGIPVAGQKLQVGHGHAGRTVTVLVSDLQFEILWN